MKNVQQIINIIQSMEMINADGFSMEFSRLTINLEIFMGDDEIFDYNHPLYVALASLGYLKERDYIANYHSFSKNKKNKINISIRWD